VDPNKFGIHLTTIAGEDFGIGDSDEKFSIQSISKANSGFGFFSFWMKIWKRVGTFRKRF
jgi:glutaminase